MTPTKAHLMTHRLALIAALTLLPLAGCGYSSKPLYNRGVTSVAVSMFGNKTFRRDWEFRLTEALSKQIDQRTPYKRLPRERADTVITGEIVDIREANLSSRWQTAVPRENELILVINFTWKDAKTGRVYVERKNFSRSATHILPLGERVEDSTQRAIEECAYAIVSQLQRDF